MPDTSSSLTLTSLFPFLPLNFFAYCLFYSCSIFMVSMALFSSDCRPEPRGTGIAVSWLILCFNLLTLFGDTDPPPVRIYKFMESPTVSSFL